MLPPRMVPLILEMLNVIFAVQIHVGMTKLQKTYYKGKLWKAHDAQLLSVSVICELLVAIFER